MPIFLPQHRRNRTRHLLPRLARKTAILSEMHRFTRRFQENLLKKKWVLARPESQYLPL